MAIDGSFNLKLALETFSERCPKVEAFPFFSSVLSKGGEMVVNKEVIHALSDVFLHPECTIPLVHCFLPIIRRVVDKVVGLLHLVGDLKSSTDYSDDVSSVLDNAMKEGTSVTEFYVRRGQRLELHECACLAFSRALHLNSSLLGSILNYFKEAPPPYQRILVKETIYQLHMEATTAYMLCLRVSYRFLVIRPEIFSKLWDWSCYLDSMKRLSECPTQKRHFSEKHRDAVWCGIQILSVVLRCSDRVAGCFGFEVEEALSCLLRWEEFCQDIEIEKAGLYIQLPTYTAVKSLQQFNTLAPGIHKRQSAGLETNEPLMKIRRLDTWDVKSFSEPFEIHSRVEKSFEMVSLAVSQKRPVLLYGPSGSGKSALIRKLADESGTHVVFIHMDDQLDGKTLVGTYVCTDQPGEFKWQPGSLTQAIMNGFWVVLEDIDKAPSDVPLVLSPLLGGSGSFLTSQGEEIRIAESFQLFSTISTPECSVSHIREAGNSLSPLWRRIVVYPPDRESLQSILSARYQNLVPVAEKLIETFETVNSALRPQYSGSTTENSATFSSPSRFSLRDLLKWCERVHGLSSFDGQAIFQEAADIFSASYMSSKNRVTVSNIVANIWNVAVPESQHKPPIQEYSGILKIGRVSLPLGQTASHDRSRFVETSTSTRLLEKIARSVEYNEPVLLVGETGTGKTTLVQNLAHWIGQKLTVLNLSQQSDIVDLLGGFKPIDAKIMCTMLYNEFNELARSSKIKDDASIMKYLQKHFRAKKWDKFLERLMEATDGIEGYSTDGIGKFREERSGRKRKKPEEIVNWAHLSKKVKKIRHQISSGGMVFTFVEGAFVTALREGHWVLLDEVNLAPPEILGRLIGVLEGVRGSLCLAERGDVMGIPRHLNFRLFACMNPATDAGKRDLPFSFRSRFTEYAVDENLSDADLEIFVRRFLGGRESDSKLVGSIVCFYKEAKRLSEETLQDGANQKPQYSLRSLYRALEYAIKAEGIGGFQKALYDGFSMFFLSLLDASSAKIMEPIIKRISGGNIRSQPLQRYLGELKGSSDKFVESYVQTKSIIEHLNHLAHAIFIKRYPVLLQGPTSSGKTSLVKYLAAISGNKFVRINNHEQTDIQEYLGSYMTDSSGKLVFHEGALVKAVRGGHWIVLDELNLAPSDVLEALNRLLDDNRELFVPELSETISAHPNFMLFATQNPPTLYGGRKILSRAFRNRFVEIHVDEIPEDELTEILSRKCIIPNSHASKMVEVMKDLQRSRQTSKAFAGKHGYITPRDLFRWAYRSRTYRDGISYEELAREGYYILAERLRDDTEKVVVQEVLERHFRVSLTKDDLYKMELPSLDYIQNRKFTWTQSMRRLFFLINRSYELHEPVLLVGDTGGGKTTICQILSDLKKKRLHILNCHQYTETSDFLGGFFPVRDRSKLVTEYENQVKQLELSQALAPSGQDIGICADISGAELLIKSIEAALEKYKNDSVVGAAVTQQDVDVLEKIRNNMVMLYQKWSSIFVWQDGPLVEAMRAGNIVLVDEISLADDSVLERMNSVLETDRKLSLAEKGGPVLEDVVAHEQFFVLATMNPGGDYGKKELSPALRNRFTEIWVPPITDTEELRRIAFSCLSGSKESNIVDPIINFWEWFNRLQTGRTLTVRDLLSWVAFVNMINESIGPAYAILHGAFLVLLDGLSLGTGFSGRDGQDLREKCFAFLLQQLQLFGSDTLPLELSRMELYGWGDTKTICEESNSVRHEDMFGIDPFFIGKGDENPEIGGFEFLAPTTHRNVLRVLRAMQLSKPILLEGSPGVGKTSLILALGKYSGHKVVRINLSEQTDMMDLLGSDLPVESDADMKFAWSDGILLQALKEGSWVLLDELNLAPQSVLEGLNAILDHRAQVFIPELGCTFECPPTFRVFACQNPSSQGGGRKGLPKSFLNRFTKVYVDELVEEDYLFICRSLYPSIPSPLLSKFIALNRQLHDGTMLHRKFGQDGSPWEFNLRDVIRSCQFMQEAIHDLEVESFLNVLYVQRMRTATDRKEVLSIYKAIFDKNPSINPYPRVQLNPGYLVVGTAAIKRNLTQSNIAGEKLKILPEIRQNLEAVAHCVQNQWLCILVGPSSSGKTSVIRILAQLTGFPLNEINLSSATDSSDLLGCFEQYNAFRNFRLVVTRVEHLVDEYNSLLSQSSQDALLNNRSTLVSSWLSYLNKIDSSLVENPSFFLNDSKTLSELEDIVKNLQQVLEEGVLPVSLSKKYLDQILKTILQLQNHVKKQSTKFEWVTGMLIKAIEKGEWVVLKNANLCNPTVLDRINSLVEPCGSITINECGIINGEPVTVVPHPNFRLFLSVNPKFGEVSRAMRNRGVEVFMMGPHWQLNEEGSNCEEFVLKGVERFLSLSGIPGYKLVTSMAKAHVHAWVNGQTFGVRITYLELEQWVHLFQLLLMNGNQLLWSLQLSWEHIYLSSLGVSDGKEVVDFVRDTYLSDVEHSELDTFIGGGLCLPGGWPKPFNLRDLTWYSRETTVRQNCMYLEFLGAQYASHQSKISYNVKLRDMKWAAEEPRIIYTIDSWRLKKVLFPKALIGSSCAPNAAKFEDDLPTKMLLFAANWTIEQATEEDIQLYLAWFSWFGSRLQQYCPFLLCFLNMLKDEFKHPIWKHISSCRKNLKSLCKLDPDAVPIPMLSSKLINVAASNDQSKPYSESLFESLNSIGVLRLSYQQWLAESNNNRTHVSPFTRFLDSLCVLEKKILREIVGAPSFSVLIQLYTEVIEKHSFFWSSLVSSSDEYLLFSFWSLIKAIKKLHSSFPEEVQVVLEESKNINNIVLHGHPEKSLLWAYGGHPSLPISAELFHKQQEFLRLCSTVWPLKSESDEQDNHLTKAIAFSGPELCRLALEGLCISSYIADEDDVDYVAAVQLDEIYQTFLERLKLEKKRLEDRMCFSENENTENKSASCCGFSPEIVATKSGFSSWVEICFIASSESCSLDVELLGALQHLLVAQPTEHQDFVDIRKLLKPSIEYSLSSSRPPQTLVAHQKIMWAIDARASQLGVDAKITSFVLEMWYWWHSFLWKNSQIGLMNISDTDNCRFLSPSMLIQPVKTATVAQILENVFSVKDYSVQSMKLFSASRHLWKSLQPYQEMPASLMPIARSLFQQMIYAHQKSFEPEMYMAIKSAFFAIEKKQNMVDGIRSLISLIGTSTHEKLKSVTHSFVGPLAKYLYSECASNEFYSNLGLAWLYLGGIRFHLLNSLDVIDPAMKITCKLLELEKKISSLELNIKVRGECEYLSGILYSENNDEKSERTLYKLKTEHKRLQRKVIFRSDPKKYQDLRRALDEFAGFLTRPISLVNEIEMLDWNQTVEQVFNWQETATSFIDRLSSDYSEYVDITQPIQVSVYEMKLGLSLFVSGALLGKLLNKFGIDMVDSVMETVYALMKFPRGSSLASTTYIECLPPLHLSHGADSRAKSLGLDVGLLHKLISVSSAEDTRKASELQLKVALYKNLHARVLQFVANAGLMDEASFELLDKIYFELARIWMEMKLQSKTKADNLSGLYKFRSRDFKIESVMEVDISALGKYFPNDSFSEWQEYLADDDMKEMTHMDQDEENLEDDWNLIQEHLDNIYSTHNELFGFCDLSEKSGRLCITDSRRLDSFTDSYELGVHMIKGLRGLFTSSLDAKLVPEHLLRLCLENKKTFTSNYQSASKYNFYKDFDGPELGKMVKFLTAFQRRINSLLQEREDHSGLQKLSDVLRMLLDIPSSTPLAKALSGLQFLLCKVHKLQEEGCKLPISDLLEPIISLASSWQKVEFERWPTLLDEVQDQYELNARKLWLPLFSVLFQKDGVEISAHENESISESLVEFIETSNVGEFKRRLQLLFCFLLQLYLGSSLGMYSSDSHKRKLEICYNIFGFYIQFLPLVMEQLELNRKNVEAELKEVLKLCRWERPDNYLFNETTKRTRQKVKKLIGKFTDMLRVPVMLVRPDLAKERAQFLPLLCPDLLNGASDMRIEVLVSALDAEQLNDRSSWYAVWWDKLKESVGRFHQEMHFKTLLTGEEHQFSSPVYQGDWKTLWSTVSRIGETVADCSNLWRNSDRDFGKKRGLIELLKLLEISGLQKHKFENVEMSNHFKGLLYQPAYDPKHLLLLTHTKSSMHSSKAVEEENKENSLVEWRVANEFYFKSLASVQLMLNVDRKHSDVTSEQVKRSVSFLNHLVEIQRQQRKSAYGFAGLLNRFRQCVLSLAKLLGDSVGVDEKDNSVFSFPTNQHAIFNCLWLQKQLFDNITAMLLEESALLRTVASTHLDSCQAFKTSSQCLLSFIEKLIPIAQNSKASLDRLLLDCNGYIVTPSSCLNQFVTQHMVQLLRQNFDQLTDLENQISTFCEDNEKSYAREVLLRQFSPVFKEGKLLAGNLNCLLNVGDLPTVMEPKEQFFLEENLSSIFANVKDVIGKLCTYKDGSVSQEAEGNITTWDDLVKKAENDLNLDNLCKMLSETFGSIGQLLNSSGVLSACVGDQLKQLQAFLDLLLSFGDCYLKEFLAISKTVSLITHVLASVLADLFTNGFGISKNDEDDGSKDDKSEAAGGTGMGDGVGAKDVSDQIEDEDQLRGTDKKEEEEKEQDTPDDVLGKNKGIEMSDDFDGKEYSVSEDEEEDKENEESEDEQLDSAIGDAGSDAEKADEKPWNKDEEDEEENLNEKNESGPSIVDKDTRSRELGAKDDGVDTADEPEESDNPGEGKDEDVDQDSVGDTENLEDKIQTKEEALADTPGLTPDVGNEQVDDDMEIDETEEEDGDQQEEPCPEDQNHPEEGENDQETQVPAEEKMEDGAEDVCESPQKEEPGNDLEQKPETEPIEGKEAMSEDMKNPNCRNENNSGVESGSQNPHGSNVSGAGSTAPQENLSATDVTDELTDSMDVPSGSNTEMNLMMSSLASGETLTDNIPKMEFPQNQSSTAQQTKVNPYRNVGDALKEWKERVRVSSDLGENQEAENEMEDPDTGEYGFASQFDAGTSQALGPALPEQVNTDMREGESEEEKLAGNQDEVSPMDIDDLNPENKPASRSKPLISNSITEQVQKPETDRTHQENSPFHNSGDGYSRMDSVVSVDNTFLGDDAYNLDRMQLTDNDSESNQDNQENPNAKNNAVILWRKCELLTAKPSQELAEQLRLVLEPTLASKLSGDYRTGKRINMKKVIPYIASHYRKDKIWLRRTKPNKRDYQVVIAVDDSRSMSESGCGDFAIRALATVCRAMSQLEMGSVAVASFGKQGSIKMLHDFGQSFTTESGIKMISGLTFNQENLIEDQPVVNLLRNMNEMLENLASTRRQSYGSNPLQQLVLIIGDGKFHEREKLKRSVRSFLQKKRMVVYLLLDDAEQSVMDLKDYGFDSEMRPYKKCYLDSFPFPYYIVLKDIEALPRTLGDVLRQWFELMQNSRD
ncbi:PREDICTED: midasin-like isoform X2 [Camelina sativa]|uniref:Midasin n=1 Tax=Camelina sativa TaxID=90675 RepID=A0ABM0WG41_CAMSA|nr:PREDICTED: midasin-like isoform X2 [Camelina sativa]